MVQEGARPHALQFNSSFRPRRQSGVWVAPQFEHPALTSPEALLPFVPDDGSVIEELLTVAPGPDERVVAPWVRTLSVGLDELEPVGVSLRWPSFEGETVLRGASGKVGLRKGGVVVFERLALHADVRLRCQFQLAGMGLKFCRRDGRV